MKIKKKQLLVFGYGLAVILTFIGVRLWLKHGWVVFPVILGAVSVVLAGITVIDYQRLIPFYKRWMKVVHLIGTVFTTVILSIVFYLVFGISGLILRLLGKDLLDRKLEPKKESYWGKRKTAPFDKNRYTQQF